MDSLQLSVISSLVLCILVPCWSIAQVDGPLGATRWVQGASWNLDGSVNDAPGQADIKGVIACGSSANTQSQIQPTGLYDPVVFGIETPAEGCVEPSSGAAVAPLGPTEGEPIIWLNFDVRPSAGTYEIQINDNSGDFIGWALYASKTSSRGTAPSPLTGTELSGDPGDLFLLTCGVESANTWNALPVPDFPDETNCYLAIWDQDADGDLSLNNFKARFGCGESDQVLCSLGVTDVSTTCDGANYVVTVGFDGINGAYSIDAPAALSIEEPAVVCFGSVVDGGELNATVNVHFETGVEYAITIQAVEDDSGCTNANNLSDCFVMLTGQGPDCSVPGCMDPCACNYNADANVDDGSCENDCLGCTYESAVNFDVNAILDDGSCEFEGCQHSGCVAYNVLATVQPEGACANPSGFADFNQDGLVQVNDLGDMLQAYSSASDNWNGVQWVQNACNGNSLGELDNLVAIASDCPDEGCMYPQAMNYDGSATQGRGNCWFAGCTDVAALNYNVHATVEDGTCRYTMCPDFNNDGLVQLNDLLDFLGAYGNVYL